MDGFWTLPIPFDGKERGRGVATARREEWLPAPLAIDRDRCRYRSEGRVIEGLMGGKYKSISHTEWIGDGWLGRVLALWSIECYGSCGIPVARDMLDATSIVHFERVTDIVGLWMHVRGICWHWNWWINWIDRLVHSLVRIMKLGEGKLPLLLMLDQLDQFLVLHHPII